MRHQRFTRYRWYLLDGVQLLAIALASVALVPTLGHLFLLSSSLQLSPNDYLLLQRHGQSAWLVEVTGLLALAGLVVHTFLVRGQAAAFAWSIVGASGLAAVQIVFWSVIFPISAATERWTLMPDDFANVRAHWEYAMAAVGVMTFGALLALMRAVEASRPIVSLSILESIEKDAAVRAARQRARAVEGERPEIGRAA